MGRGPQRSLRGTRARPHAWTARRGLDRGEARASGRALALRARGPFRAVSRRAPHHLPQPLAAAPRGAEAREHAAYGGIDRGRRGLRVLERLRARLQGDLRQAALDLAQAPAVILRERIESLVAEAVDEAPVV